MCDLFLYTINSGTLYCPIIDYHRYPAVVTPRYHEPDSIIITAGKESSSFDPHEGGDGGVTAALPTRIFIGNGARLVLAERVAPRYSDRVSSPSSCIGTAFDLLIQRYRHDAHRFTMTKLGRLASCSRGPLHS